MGKRIDAGQPLPQVVAELGTALPPAYQTVIAAGLRAGRLPAALEGVARTARRISQLRRSIGLSLIYPVILLVRDLGPQPVCAPEAGARSWPRCSGEFDVTSLPVDRVRRQRDRDAVAVGARSFRCSWPSGWPSPGIARGAWPMGV